MHGKLRFGVKSLGFAGVLGGVWLMSCSSQDQPAPTPATGGVVGTTGGVVGTTGGAAGATSSAGSGGGGGLTPYACVAKAVTATPITDFAMLSPEMWFGDYTNKMDFWGGAFAPYGGLTGDVTGGNFHVTGTVSTYSGFGLFFGSCSDVTMFQGITFTLSGTLDTAGMIKVFLQTNNNKPVTASEMKGACVSPTPDNPYNDCIHNSKLVPVTTTPTPITLLWADFTGGKPEMTVNTGQVLGLEFQFAWATGMAMYPVDVILDDVHFSDGTSGGAGGGGGAGGASAGAGGASAGAGGASAGAGGASAGAGGASAGAGGASAGAGGASAGAGGASAGAGGASAGSGGASAGAGGGPSMALCMDFCMDNIAACTAGNQQYASQQACMTACAGFDPDDSPDNGDTYGCRRQHLNLVQSMPTDEDYVMMHCPHTGPDGGGVCED